MDELEPSFVEGAAPWAPDRTFLARSDSPSLLRLTTQLAFVGALIGFATRVPGSAALVLVPLAGALAALFAPFHESLHRTAFATRALNDAAAWATGLFFLASPAGYRAFHFAHHRHTQHPTLDPEIAPSPGFIGRWPRGPIEVAARVSGLGIALGKLAAVTGQALLPAATWDRWAPYVPANVRGRVAWEARLLLGWAAFVGIASAHVPGLWVLPTAWGLSHAFLGYWLTTEHTGLAPDLPILARTRTVLLPAPLRWWVWNMSFHAEHHAWPAVPWHRLPEVHARARPPETWPSYLAIWRAHGARRALRSETSAAG